jgi:hypothetical protein
MGLLATIAGPLAEYTSNTSTTVLVLSGLATFLVVSIVLNVLKQLLWRNPHEPPLVFHWVPFIGSTVTYGMDPLTFFHNNKKKVYSIRAPDRGALRADLHLVWQCLYLHSPRQEDNRVSGYVRKQFHFERENERCQRGGDLQ